MKLRDIFWRRLSHLLLVNFLIMLKARGVVQQIANSDAFPIGRELGNNSSESVVVAQLTVMDQHHDRHCGELLAYRSQPKISGGCNWSFGLQVSQSVAACEDQSTVMHHANCQARGVC